MRELPLQTPLVRQVAEALNSEPMLVMPTVPLRLIGEMAMKKPKTVRWFIVLMAAVNLAGKFLITKPLGEIFAMWRSLGMESGTQPNWGAICLGMFGLFGMSWVGTWQVLSQKKLQRFAWVFPIFDLLPSIAGFLVGYCLWQTR